MTAPCLAPVDPIRVLVVDDEPLAREDLLQLLARRTGVTVVGTCASGVQAVDAVARLTPDLLLLDIRMPGLDGFGVVSRLDRAHMPHIVFVTAYDQHAIDAFQVRALDYLLKPVESARLDEALARVRERLPLHAAYWIEVLVRTGLRDVVVRVDDIDWIEADTYYARLHVRGRSYLLRERMHILAHHLDPTRFVRIHRSAIINMTRVASIQHVDGDHVVVLASGTRVKTSHTGWQHLRSVLRG